MKWHNVHVPVGWDAQTDLQKAGCGTQLARSGQVLGLVVLPSVSDETQPGDSPAATLPAPPPTKSKPRTSREFERALRELGYSKTESRTIASHGFKGLQVEDPANDVSELAALIERNTSLLEHIERALP